MKLEVGKKYRNGRGETVTIIKHNPPALYPFIGNNGSSYLESGACSFIPEDSNNNLIEEAVDEDEGFPDCKIRVRSKEQSAAIQQHLFSKGCVWQGDNSRQIQYTGSKFLFLRSKRLAWGNTESSFESDSIPEYRWTGNELVLEVKLATIFENTYIKHTTTLLENWYGETIFSEENKVDFIYEGDTKMELKDMKKSNLKEAAKKVKEERMNAEVEYATRRFRQLSDRKDTLEREIQIRADEIVELDKELQLFEGK